MGFLDHFRPRRKSLDEMIEDLPKARTLHYVFAHVAFRQFAFEHPLEVVSTLHSANSAEFLRSVWDDVAEQVKSNGEPVSIVASALGATAVRVGDFPCAVVRMPPAMAPTECHYVALVLHVDLRQDPETATKAPEKPRLSYFTLELGASMDGPERTVIGAWNEAGAHLNYGDGPMPPEVDAFVEAITKLVQRDSSEDVKAGFNPGSGDSDDK